MRLISDDIWAVLTIWQEARGELQPGKVAVAEVIRNRTQQHHQSDGTVAGTVLKAAQFSGWNTRDPNRLACARLEDTDPQVIACREAWQEALDGSNVTHGALYYLNPKAVPELPAWVDVMDEVAVIGRHHFFRPKGG